MDASHHQAAARCAACSRPLAAALIAALLAIGCRTDPINPFLADVADPHDTGPDARAGSILDGAAVASEPLDLSHLADKNWIEQVPKSYARRGARDRRWRHARLDGYLHPDAPRTDLRESLASKDPVMATNAAILAAYWGEGDPIERLQASITHKNLPLPLRCAAAEALGYVQKPAPAPAIRELLAGVRTPDLHAELLRALARHAEPSDARFFTAALANPAWQVRLEAVAGWGVLADATLPPAAIELRRDRDPRVRAMALRTIAAHRDQRAIVYLQEAMSDEDFDVRVAATAGLRAIGTADARELLERVKGHGAQLQQTADLAAAAADSLQRDLQSTAADAQQQLRQAVAETLDQAEARGRQLAAEQSAAARGAVEQASAQVAAVADQARAAADNVQARVRAAHELAAALRQSDLTEAARRQASEALARLAMDASAEVRTQAARAMGELADPVFLPALVGLLSDEPDVQTAAMASLVAVAGSDQAASAASQAEKVRAWQLWYAQRPGNERR